MGECVDDLLLSRLFRSHLILSACHMSHPLQLRTRSPAPGSPSEYIPEEYDVDFLGVPSTADSLRSSTSRRQRMYTDRRQNRAQELVTQNMTLHSSAVKQSVTAQFHSFQPTNSNPVPSSVYDVTFTDQEASHR